MPAGVVANQRIARGENAALEIGQGRRSGEERVGLVLERDDADAHRLGHVWGVLHLNFGAISSG